MIKLLSWLFGSTTKNGKCKWWAHLGTIEIKHYNIGTNRYIDGKEITRRVYFEKYTCKKCGETWYE